MIRYNSLINSVKTQVLLDVAETLQIAEDLSIKHPWNNRKKSAAVMSTDFIIECPDNVRYAVTVKYSSQLTKRVIEKFDIENSYWSKRGYKFSIFTGKEVDETRLYNANFIHDYFDCTVMECQKSYFIELKKILNSSSILTPTIKEANQIISDKLDICFATGLRCFKYLLAI
ncbi:TnsA endonuclease N-terminal domain-containing protein [Marivirga tractuosa]|uniref:TnsA endonuclease N-terminal domain-containing protein n=1 Tax=Marivirga tractuosa TaxID=1006 RepID=UPI0035CFF80C